MEATLEQGLERVVPRLTAVGVVEDSVVAATGREGPKSGPGRICLLSAHGHGAAIVLEIGQPIRGMDGIHVGTNLPVKVAVADVADFQASILPEFALNSEVVLPTIGHLVCRFAAYARTAKTGAKARGSASSWLRQTIQEASVRCREVTQERRVVSANLQREETVAVEELPGTSSNRPLTSPCRIPGNTKARSEHVIVIIPQSTVRTGYPTGARRTRIGFEVRRVQQTVAGGIAKCW